MILTKLKLTISVSLAMSILIFLHNQTRNNFQFLIGEFKGIQEPRWTLDIPSHMFRGFTHFENKNFENNIRNACAVNVLQMKSFKMASAMRSSSTFLIQLVKVSPIRLIVPLLNSESAQLVKFEKQIQQLNAKVAPRIKYHLQQDASNVKSRKLQVAINASRVNRSKSFLPRRLV